MAQGTGGIRGCTKTCFCELTAAAFTAPAGVCHRCWQPMLRQLRVDAGEAADVTCFQGGYRLLTASAATAWPGGVLAVRDPRNSFLQTCKTVETESE